MTELKQKIPNILSISRAFIALTIPFTGKVPMLFLAVILICGITDALDGYLARKWNCQSELGSKLDSLGDWIMGLGITAYLLFWQMELIRNYLPLIIAIISTRLLSLLVCYLHNKHVYSIHTWLNKFTGIVVFTGICLLPLFKNHPEMKFIFGLALLSSLEELIIFIVFKHPDMNHKSIFHRH